jgi:streptogramin lyase
VRTGILELFDSSNSVIGSILLSGIGTGGMATVDPAPLTVYTVTDGQIGAPATKTFVRPMAVAMDPAGDIFVGDWQGDGYGGLYEIPAGKTTASSAGVTFAEISGLTFDASGNLYLADQNAVQVAVFPNEATDGSFKFSSTTKYKILINGTSPTFGGNAITTPLNVAVGPDGTLYVADYVFVFGSNLSRIVSYNLNTGATAVVVTGLSAPRGLAVDAAGNLYVADYNTGNVLDYTNGILVQTLNVGGSPFGLAIDPSGSLLVSGSSAGAILRIPNKNGTLSLADAARSLPLTAELP